MQSIKQKYELDQITEDSKTILGIVGSPRKGANTDTLVDSVLAGAEEYGATSIKVNLTELKIAPCRACNNCQRQDTCIHDDDMRELIELMEKSDIWVLGTPVYWWGPTAQMKAFIDRWYGVDQRIYQGKDVIFAISMGGTNDHYARHTVGMFQDICNYLGMNCIEKVVVTGMNSKDSVRENFDCVERARSIGINAVKV